MRYLPSFTIIAVAAAFFSVSPAVTAQENAGGGIQASMTPEQFKAAGLDKLSPKELENLNKWLQGDRETTVKAASQRAERQAAELVVSRVDGTFTGLKGRTIIRLEDGTAWKQANQEDVWRATPVERPAAVVMRSVFGRKMRVQGSPDFYVNAVK